jgi:glycosyltransferase involved in cell wall biosynthesis
MPTNITYIISNHTEKALAFEWIADGLDKQRFNLSFILLNPTGGDLEDELLKRQIPVVRVRYRGKKDLPSAFIQVRRTLKKLETQVVHTHLFEAGLIGLLAAKSLGIKKRILTRHHATQHHDYFPRAVYYDRFISYLATHIIAPSRNVKNILTEKEFVRPTKIYVIHHGFRLEEFTMADATVVKILRQKYQVEHKYPVIGLIARYTHLKGIQYVIPAFRKILKDYPQAHLILANAKGDYTTEIKQLLAEIPPNSYTEIVFEPNVQCLYHCFDVFVNTTIAAHSEAFGQTYVEALAAGIPSVFTLSGVAAEFIRHEQNALIVPFQDDESIYKALIQLLQDSTLREKLRTQGRKDVQDLFTLQKMIASLAALYES